MRSSYVGLLVLTILLSGCGRKPSQPYAMAGSIEAAPDIRAQLDLMLKRSPSATLRMTLRTTPDVSSIVLQRQWAGVGLPHAFGIGRDQLDEMRSQLGADAKVFVTALIDVPFGGDGASLSFIGWTRSAVDLGLSDLVLMLDRRLGAVDPATEINFPTGGWFSSAAPEDAPPPGVRAVDPGPLVFGGQLDVSDPVFRTRFSTYKVFVIATFRPDGGAPELINRYEYPVFPFRYALHENNRMFGDAKEITDPLHIVALLDGDGRIDTKEDQIRLSTPERVKPGRTDVDFVFPIDPQKFSKENPAAPSSSTALAEEVVVSGSIVISDEDAARVPPGSVLYVSAFDGADQLILSRRIDGPTFPNSFDLARKHSLNGAVYTGPIEGLRIRAILSASGDAIQKTPQDLESPKTAAAAGTQGLVLTLKPRT